MILVSRESRHRTSALHATESGLARHALEGNASAAESSQLASDVCAALWKLQFRSGSQMVNRSRQKWRRFEEKPGILEATEEHLDNYYSWVTRPKS